MNRIYLIILVGALFPGIASHSCEEMEEVYPRFSKMIEMKKRDYEKIQGEVEEYYLSKIFLEKLCNFQTEKEIGQTKLFSSKNMHPFIIDNRCNIILGLLTKAPKKIVKHVVLAAGKKTVGGGLIQCRQESGKKIIYLTNNSSRYCFPIAPLKAVVNSLDKISFPIEDIRIKFKQKKFCAEKKSRSLKILNRIKNKKYTFGFKKSHIHNGQSFLDLFNAKN